MMSDEPIRRQILRYLKHAGDATVDELSRALGVPRSTLRQHLAMLAKDAMVRERSRPDGVGRPRKVYGPGPAADAEFPKRHGELLRMVLETLRGRDGRQGLQRLCDNVQARLIEEHQHLRGIRDPERRLRAVAEVLIDRGDIFEFGREGSGFALRFYDCPFGELPREFPELCGLAQGVVEGLGGLPVTIREWQVRGDRRCVFRVDPPVGPAEIEAAPEAGVDPKAAGQGERAVTGRTGGDAAGGTRGRRRARGRRARLENSRGAC